MEPGVIWLVVAALGWVPIHHPVRVTHAAVVRWMKVHVCEERGHGWHVDGPTYFGGLGWVQATWDQFRRPDFPKSAAMATITQQIWAAQRFAGFYHFVPDQHGCWAQGY